MSIDQATSGRCTLVDFLEIVCGTDGTWFRRMPLYIQEQLNAAVDWAYLEDESHPRHVTFRLRIPWEDSPRRADLGQ